MGCSLSAYICGTKYNAAAQASIATDNIAPAVWYEKRSESHIPAPPPKPVPPSVPAWYQPPARPFLLSFTVFAIKPPTGATTKVAAICESNTMADKNATEVLPSGIEQSSSKVNAQKPIPMKYHLCRLSVRSVSGAR